MESARLVRSSSLTGSCMFHIGLVLTNWVMTSLHLMKRGMKSATFLKPRDTNCSGVETLGVSE